MTAFFLLSNDSRNFFLALISSLLLAFLLLSIRQLSSFIYANLWLSEVYKFLHCFFNQFLTEWPMADCVNILNWYKVAKVDNVIHFLQFDLVIYVIFS